MLCLSQVIDTKTNIQGHSSLDILYILINNVLSLLQYFLQLLIMKLSFIMSFDDYSLSKPRGAARGITLCRFHGLMSQIAELK